MIKDQIKIHAGQSFELKLNFPQDDFSKRNSEFEMDMFLFLPPTLDINKHNFTRHDFYKSLKSYIRLASPDFELANLVDPDFFLNRELFESAEMIVKPGFSKPDDLFIRQLKDYVSIVNQSVSVEIRRLLQDKNPDENETRIEEFVAQCYRFRRLFWYLMELIGERERSQSVVKAAALVDEYQSLMLESQLYVFINSLLSRYNEDHPVIVNLHHLVMAEMKYRKKVKYPSVATENQLNEDILHRRGRIKRYIESNLFLNTDTRKEGVFYEQLFFSLAAGIAMVFATGIAFASQYAFGNLTMPFFAVLVISYMFKDRIKELSRTYFDKQRKKMLFDFRTAISIQKNDPIGTMRESFRFEKRSTLPPRISEARERMRVTEIREEWIGDKVIHYKTKIKISSRQLKKLSRFSGFTQIFRLNISPFTVKMDDHEKEVFIKSKKRLKRQVINRVYHLNLIFRFTAGDDQQYKYYKLITDKKGVKRIDRIAFDD